MLVGIATNVRLYCKLEGRFPSYTKQEKRKGVGGLVALLKDFYKFQKTYGPDPSYPAEGKKGDQVAVGNSYKITTNLLCSRLMLFI